MVQKELIPVESENLATREVINSPDESMPIPQSGEIFNSQVTAESVPIRLRTKPLDTDIVVFSELVSLARETGSIDSLSERRRMVVDMLHPEEGQALNVLQISGRMKVAHQAIRKLKVKAYRELVGELGDKLPSSSPASRTKGMEEIEEKYNMDVVQVLILLSRTGMSRREMARRLHRDHKTIAIWFDNISVEEPRIEIRKTFAMRRVEDKFGQEIKYLLKRLYTVERRTCEEVAGDLGVSVRTFRDWMRHFGVKIRSASEARMLSIATRKEKVNSTA